MAFFGSIATVEAQLGDPQRFAATFAYLRDLFAPDSAAGRRLRAVAIGETKRIDLAGGAFALEQVYRTKARPDGFFEGHQKYIDVQVIFEGEECMEVVDQARIAVAKPYVAERDLVVFDDVADASRLWLVAGEAAVFYPADVHMPCLRCGEEPALVRKTVVKVPV